MTETELKKMSRSELLQMLILQSDENTALKSRVEELEKQIEKREILIGQSGSIAEAALKLSGIFEAADRAVAEYQNGIRRLNAEQQVFLKAKREEAEKEAAAIVLKAKVQADKSRQEAERYWDNLSIRLEAFYREHKGLQELLNSTGGIRK